MIVVRNVFQLKFGKARDAKEAMKALIAINRKLGVSKEIRILTDVTGPFYTMVLEMAYSSLTELDREQAMMGDASWKDAYAKFVPLVRSGHREVFNVVE